MGLLVSQPVKLRPDTIACTELVGARAHVLFILSPLPPGTVGAGPVPVSWRRWKAFPVPALETAVLQPVLQMRWAAGVGRWSAEVPAGGSLHQHLVPRPFLANVLQSWEH